MLRFKEWLFLEIDKSIARSMLKLMHELPYNDIFPEGKTRIAFPVTDDEIAASILKKIKDLGFRFDYFSGLVHKIGSDKITYKIGKFIKNPKFGFTEEEKYWFDHQGQVSEALQLAQEVESFMIIMSRNPIDIVRMGDHDSYISCLNPSRQHFDSALAEARGGGIVAYLVNKDDLEGVNLDSPEIFTDPKRKIQGIVPVSRIWVKKFHNRKEDYDLLVPEVKVYGQKVPGFYSATARWLLQRQQGVLKGKTPSMKDFIRVGGSYADNYASTLFNAFFGTREHGDVKHEEGEINAELLADQYDEEIRKIDAEYRDKFNFVFPHAEAEAMEDHAYVFMSASIQELIKGEVLKEINYQSERDLRSKIGDICDHLRIYRIEDTEIESENDGILVKIYMNNDDDNNHNPEGYRDFVYFLLNDVEPKKERFIQAVRSLFIEEGYLKPHYVSKLLGYGGSENAWEEQRFQNFSWDVDDGENQYTHTIFVSAKDSTNYAQGQGQDKYLYLGTLPYDRKIYGWVHNEPGFNQIKSYLMRRIYDIAKSQIEARNSQRTLFDIPKQRMPFTNAFNLEPDMNFYGMENQTDENKVDMYFSLKFHFDITHDEYDIADAIAFIDYLDKNFALFIREAQAAFVKIVAPKYIK